MSTQEFEVMGELFLQAGVLGLVEVEFLLDRLPFVGRMLGKLESISSPVDAVAM